MNEKVKQIFDEYSSKQEKINLFIEQEAIFKDKLLLRKYDLFTVLEIDEEIDTSNLEKVKSFSSFLSYQYKNYFLYKDKITNEFSYINKTNNKFFILIFEELSNEELSKLRKLDYYNNRKSISINKTFFGLGIFSLFLTVFIFNIFDENDPELAYPFFIFGILISIVFFSIGYIFSYIKENRIEIDKK